MKDLLRVVVVGFVIVGFFAVGFAGKLTPAEEMTRCLPDGTIVFVAGSGMDSIGPAFDKTALGKILGNEQLRTSFESLWGQAMALGEKEIGDPETVEAIKLFMELGQIVCKRPFIAGIAENDNGGDVPISGFVIIDAGPVRKELTKVVSKIEKLDDGGEIFKKTVGPCRMKAVKIRDKQEKQYVYWGWAGRNFVVGICDNDGLLLKNIFWPSKDIAKGLDKIPQAGDALIISYDFKAIQSLMEKCLKETTPKEYTKIKTLIEELGISELGTVAARVGFSGANIVAGEAVDLPAPRKGLFSTYGTVDLALFDLVEPEAMKAGASNIDFGEFCKIYWGAIKKAMPEKEIKKITDQIAGFEKMTNVDICEGIIGSISGEGVYYTIPAGVMMDSPSGGFVAIAGLNNDGAKFEESMSALGQFAASKANGMLQISSMPKGDVTIHSWTIMPLAMMQIMPCWAIVDEHVVFASNMVLCGRAIDRLKSDDASQNSLRSTAKFKGATEGLPDELLSLVYTDSKVQFKQITMQMQRLWPMVTMGAMQQGIKLPAMLPNFDDALKGLTPAASYGWFDNEGIYSHYEGSGIELGVGVVAGGAMGAAILMPALGKTKKLATRLVSGTNLKGLANAINVYAFDYEDKFPPNLEILIKEADVSPKSLVSPLKPKNFKGPSYIYIAGQHGTSHPANILAYDNTEYQRDGTNVLYVDGHVAYVKCGQFIKDLKATHERLGREMPEIKFLNEIEQEKKTKKLMQRLGDDERVEIKKLDEGFEVILKQSHEKVKKQMEEKDAKPEHAGHKHKHKHKKAEQKK